MNPNKDTSKNYLDTIALVRETLKNVPASLPPNKTKKYNYWTLNDDEKLMRLAKDLEYNWVKVSLEFIERTPEELEKRWRSRIDTNTKKTPWTIEEDSKVIMLYRRYGGNWKSIAKELNGRLPSAIKNRYYSKLQKIDNLSALRQSKFDDEVKSKFIKDTESVFSMSTSCSCPFTEMEVPSKVNLNKVKDKLQNQDIKNLQI